MKLLKTAMRQIKKPTKLTPEDHRAMVLAHHEKEAARLMFELKNFEWEQACERIVTEYNVNAQTQSIDIQTGLIALKEQPK